MVGCGAGLVEGCDAGLGSDRPGVGVVRLVSFEGVGAAQGVCSFALLAAAAELRAGNTVGLGLGAACGEVEPDLLSLRRVRHLDASRQGQHTPATMSRMSQMDYMMILFQSRGGP